jgi:hypothetical protein
MYCSACGGAITQPGLSFCNHCGAKLNRSNEAGKSELKPESLVAAMVATFILGLIGISALLGVMKVILNFDLPLILLGGLVSFLIMLLLEGVFISLLLRRRPRDADEAGQLKRATKELDAGQTRFIPADRTSVTEQTTRAFDPIYKDQSSK